MSRQTKLTILVALNHRQVSMGEEILCFVSSWKHSAISCPCSTRSTQRSLVCAQCTSCKHGSCYLCHTKTTNKDSKRFFQSTATTATTTTTNMAKNPCYSLVWLILLVFIAWPVAGFCAAIWIFLMVRANRLTQSHILTNNTSLSLSLYIYISFSHCTHPTFH